MDTTYESQLHKIFKTSPRFCSILHDIISKKKPESTTYSEVASLHSHKILTEYCISQLNSLPSQYTGYSIDTQEKVVDIISLCLKQAIGTKDKNGKIIFGFDEESALELSLIHI
eukprot:TRINITY_DN1972_c0_g1_i6.p1 TRINITY_DN1972_c0_g1~~TRINITY_DN1972_c0_g1_i6.p1  ORF type:complete len:114 (+),score=3.71 TRINITY_DN1972_c0_g1_i6:215-556(+)